MSLSGINMRERGMAYSDVWNATAWRKNIWAPVIYDALRNFGPPSFVGVRVLEIGFGAGELSVLLARYGAHVVGLEIREQACAQARRNAEAAGVQHLCRFEIGDISTHVDTYDMVITKSVLFHLPRPADYARWGYHIHRLLVPGGTYLGFENGRAGRMVHAYRLYKRLRFGWNHDQLPFICDTTLRYFRRTFPNLRAIPHYRWTSTFPFDVVARVEHALQVEDPRAALVYTLIGRRH